MFDAWSGIATIGGAGVLSYLAAGQETKEGGVPTLRLSLDKGGSLLGDVRLLGGAVTGLAAAYVGSGSAKKVLSGVAFASFASLFCTELVRIRLVKRTSDGKSTSFSKLDLVPKAIQGGSFGGTSAPARSYQTQNAWANR